MKTLLTFFLCLCFSEQAFACICSESDLLENDINSTPFIFIGEALSSNIESEAYDNLRYEFLFDIKTKYKGNRNDTLLVYSSAGSCRIGFERGKEYLVFAFYDEGSKPSSKDQVNSVRTVRTYLCTRTSTVDNATRIIEKLEKLRGSINSISNFSSEKLYNEIWKDEVFETVEIASDFTERVDSLYYLEDINLNNCSLSENDPYTGNHDPSYPVNNPRLEVWVKVDVAKDGTLSNYKILTGVNKGCNQEALRFTETLATLTPSKIKNITVRYSATLVYDFEKMRIYIF